MDYRELASQFGGQIVDEEDKQKDYLELAKKFGGAAIPVATRDDQGEVDYLALAKQFGGAGEPVAAAEPEEKITGVKEKTKKGESVLAGTTLEPGAPAAPTETFKLPGFEHLYPSDRSPFDQSEQARTEKLIMKGIDPETARATAKRNIAEGKPTTGEEFGIARPLTKAEELGEELRYQAGKTGIEDTAQVLKRAGVKAVAGMAEAGGGMQAYLLFVLLKSLCNLEKLHRQYLELYDALLHV